MSTYQYLMRERERDKQTEQGSWVVGKGQLKLPPPPPPEIPTSGIRSSCPIINALEK